MRSLNCIPNWDNKRWTCANCWFRHIRVSRVPILCMEIFWIRISKRMKRFCPNTKSARDLGSKDFVVYQQILFLEAQVQAWDSLLTESEEALTLFPDQPVVYYLNGVAYALKEKVQWSGSCISNRCENWWLIIKTSKYSSMQDLEIRIRSWKIFKSRKRITTKHWS